MKELSKAEEMILLAILRLKDNAYGVPIRQVVLETAGKEYTFGTLYGILEQMVRKEYIQGVESEPIPERGGRRRTVYHLTETGLEALRKSLEIHRSMWKGISQTQLQRG